MKKLGLVVLLALAFFISTAALALGAVDDVIIDPYVDGNNNPTGGYHITIKNNGPNPIEDFHIRAIPPTTLGFIGLDSPEGWDWGWYAGPPNQVNWETTSAPIPPGGTLTSFKIRPDPPEDFEFTWWTTRKNGDEQIRNSEGTKTVEGGRDTARHKVGTEGGVFESPGLGRLAIDTGAVNADTTLVVQNLVWIPSRYAVPADFARIARAWEFGPNGQAFNSPITVTVPYGDYDMPGIDVNSLKAFKYHPGSGWLEVPGSTVDVANHTVTFQTSSFSLYGIGGNEVTNVSASTTWALVALWLVGFVVLWRVKTIGYD